MMTEESLFYSSNDMIKSITIQDSTVDIIGFVESISPSQKAGQQDLQKFILNNDDGSRILVKIWNEQINRVKQYIRPNFILHLDAVSARNRNYNNASEGNVHFELSIQSNTKVNFLGIHNVIEQVQKIETWNLDSIGKANSEQIRTTGYLKSKIQIIYGQSDTPKFACGSITDGKFRLEIRIFDIKSSILPKEIEKGEKLEIVGTMNFGVPVFLSVSTFLNITKIDAPKMSLKELSGAVQRIIKMRSEELPHNSKKTKIN